MDELKKMRNFNNDIKTYEERKNHIESVLKELNIDDMIRNSLNGDESTYEKIENNLDELGTYILKSHDIESERKIVNSFYQREQDSNRRAINKNTYKFEKEYLENIPMSSYLDSELHNEYIERLFFNPNSQEIRNMLKEVNSESYHIENDYIRGYIEFFFDDIVDNCKNGKDIVIANLFKQGLSSREISKKMNMQHTTVNRRFKKMTEF